MIKKNKKKLNITYIAQANYEGTGAGGGARVKNMVDLFKKMHYKIDIISYSFYSDKFRVEKRIIDDSLNSTIIHIPKHIPRLFKALAIFPVLFYAFKSSKNSDLIFSDSITTIASLPAIFLGKIFNKPVILDYIDKKLIKFVPDFFNEYVAKNADAIFAISYYLLDVARNDYNCKNVLYVPNVLDSDIFKMDANFRNETRKKLGIKDKEIVIGYSGAFIYWEGVPILLNAFRNLKEKNKNIKLAIMGNFDLGGNERDNIPELVNELNIKEDVILIDSKPYEEVPKYLSGFDILCCPKIDCEINRAANPIKVVDYLAMGLPTVCSAVGGIKDIIADGANGFLINPGDMVDLQEKIEWILINEEEAKKIGLNGRKTIEDNYSFKSMRNKIDLEIMKIVKE